MAGLHKSSSANKMAAAELEEEYNIHDDDFNLYYEADNDGDAAAKFAPPAEE